MSLKRHKDLKKLQSINDITITNTHKGGVSVIIDGKDNAKEAERPLDNSKNFEQMCQDSIIANNKTVKKVISRFDVKSLYINTPKAQEIKALKTSLEIQAN